MIRNDNYLAGVNVGTPAASRQYLLAAQALAYASLCVELVRYQMTHVVMPFYRPGEVNGFTSCADRRLP